MSYFVSLGKINIDATYYNIYNYRLLISAKPDNYSIENLQLYIDKLTSFYKLIDQMGEGYLKQLGFFQNKNFYLTIIKSKLLVAYSLFNKKYKEIYVLPGQSSLFGLNKTERFSPVKEIIRTEIITEPKTFQGREDAFAKETVNKIVAEGYDKSQEPIVVWYDDKKKKYIVISGHSRFAASEILFKKGQKDLKTMPVKVFLGDKEEAQEYALLESNRSGTAESFKSDLKAYKLAVKKGYNKQALLAIFKPESKLRLLQDLSYLNTNGQFIEHLGEDSEKHFPYLQRNAQWVGIMRKNLPQLTNAHEKELFDYLYKTNKGLSVKKDDFFNLVNNIVSKINFDASAPLNLTNIVSSNALTDPAKDLIKEIENEITKLERQIKLKRENIIRAKREGLNDIAIKLQSDITNLEKVIQNKLAEIDKIKREISKLENETVFDLFSEPAEPKKQPNNIKLIELEAESLKIKLKLINNNLGYYNNETLETKLEEAQNDYDDFKNVLIFLKSNFYYRVTFEEPDSSTDVYEGFDKKNALEELETFKPNEDVEYEGRFNLLRSYKLYNDDTIDEIDKYLEWTEEDYDSNFDYDEFYSDLFFEVTDEIEEDSITKDIIPINQNTNNLLFETEYNFQNFINKSKPFEIQDYKIKLKTNYPGSKYNSIKVFAIVNNEECEIGSIKLRIADHSYNPKNNSINWENEGFLSLTIANKNATFHKFNGEHELEFNEDNTVDEVLDEMLDEIKNQIDNWDIEKLVNQEIDLFS